jgi:mRNA interferase YafQ
VTLKIRVKSQFKKDLKKAARDPHKNTQLLKSIIDDYLIQNKTVPEQHKPHLLAGNWKPCWECHVQPDFLLIWDVDLAANELILVRCGSHAELFG